MKNIFEFFHASWTELKQVSWITPQQMVASTWLVVILVILASLYVSGIDFLLSRLFGLLI